MFMQQTKTRIWQIWNAGKADLECREADLECWEADLWLQFRRDRSRKTPLWLRL